MLGLTKRDKYEVITRNSTFMAELEEINKPFSLDRVFSPERRERDKLLRSRMSTVFKEGIPSPERVKASLERMRREQQPKEAVSGVVRMIPHEKIPGNREKDGIIRVLREGRFLKLEIDLTAAHKEDILNEVGEYIITFQPKQIRSHRRRKLHKSTNDIDMWDVYDQHSKGVTPYKIAREIYRKRTGNVAGFNADTMEYKAVQRKLKTAQGMIDRNPYPRQ